MMDSSPPLTETLDTWIRTIIRFSMRSLMLYTKEKGLSFAQINTLFRVHYKGQCGVSDLSDDLGITSAAVSQLIERLVQQGYILRTEDRQDRRVKRIELSDAGKQIIQESNQSRHVWLNSLVDKLAPDEQELVASALNTLIEKSQLL